MKHLLFFVLIAVVAAGCTPSATSSTTESGEKYTYRGEKITPENALPVANVSTMVAEEGEVSTKLQGTVKACCQKKGCWMTMELADGTDMMVRFKDYGFFVPLESAGKNAIIEGKAFMDTTSVDDLRHYAEDAGKSKEEIEKITEPEVSISFEATGVIIEDPEAEKGGAE